MPLRRLHPFAVLAIAFVLGCSGGGGGSGGGIFVPPTPPASLELQLVNSTFDIPVLVTAPRNDSRLFVVEKTGRIRIVKAGTLLPTAFLDLSGSVSGTLEQGLLGLAFDPNYSVNGRFFVYYTDLGGDARISWFQASGNPDIAMTTEHPILTIDDPNPNHNGGMLEFGPDGNLYASVGDGGEQEDPEGRAQSTTELFGNLLRLDVRAGTLGIPFDNPYAPPSRREVWCIGLRNPWRFSFDRSTGDLYIGDVGYTEREEIDVAPALLGRGRAANFGWKVIEGNRCFDPPNACNTAGLTPPVLDYDHSDGCTVIGGFVYRGAAIPSLRGTYFYADYCSRWVKSFYYSAGTLSQQREWSGLQTTGNITSFGQDAAGELYICTESGEVYRIVVP